jgi:hypothetical protein
MGFLPCHEEVQRHGFAILPNVFAQEQVESIIADLSRALSSRDGKESAIQSPEGVTYAARNLLTLWPPVKTIWRQPLLLEALRGILGPNCGLVRVLFFDKPPERTWSLPWHKDMTIAVRDNRRPSSLFAKPTRKAGVPHVEAPSAVLAAMLTARLHLDDVTEENGPLKVLPGSHRTNKVMNIDETEARHILVRPGDVLLMRPLLAHSSQSSRAGTTRHRRILHLEFAASPELPDGYVWHDFIG